MVILSHVCNFVSVKVFNKVLLTYLLTYLLVVVMYYDVQSLICRRLLVAGGKDKTAQKPASAAVTKTTQKERKAPQLPPQNINDWTSSDINKWLRNNNLQHLRSWYTTLFFVVTLYTFMAYVEKKQYANIAA